MAAHPISARFLRRPLSKLPRPKSVDVRTLENDTIHHPSETRHFHDFFSSSHLMIIRGFNSRPIPGTHATASTFTLTEEHLERRSMPFTESNSSV